MRRGIYLSPTEYVPFAGTTPDLRAEVATRENVFGFLGPYSLYLPNPDPVLRKLGKSIEVYRDLRSDAHVGGCIRRRKAAVLGMERGLDRGQARSRLTKDVEAILADLPLTRLLTEILDAPLYGYQPLEILWQKSGSYLVPADVVGKPPEWFLFSQKNELLFRSTNNPLGDPVPDKKFLLARQDPTYDNPYGFPDLSMVFWPTSFKKGGLGFWVKATERFGAPWPIGKYPRGTPADEVDTLLDALEQMVQDGVAAIADDESVTLLESAKANPAEMFQQLLMFCRSEVSIALLGQNQTIEAEANRASAQAGMEVTRDIRDGDAAIAADALNQLVRWIVDLNFGEADVAPEYQFWEQEEVDDVQAKRDEILARAMSGQRFTKAYWTRTYSLQEDDLEPTQSPATPPGEQSPAPGFAAVDPADDPTPIDPMAERMAAEAAPAWDAILEKVQALVDQYAEEGKSLLDLREALLSAYADLPTGDLADIMGMGLAAAELAGRYDVRAESP